MFTFLADLLGSQCLIEILQTSLSVKNSENLGSKMDVPEEIWDGEWQFLFQIKEEYKFSCLKILMFC